MQNFRTIRSCDPEFKNFIQGVVKFRYNVNEEFDPHPHVIFCGEKLNPTLIIDQRFLEESYRKNLKECRDSVSFLSSNSIDGCRFTLWDGTIPDFSQSSYSVDTKLVKKIMGREKPNKTFHLASVIKAYADHVKDQPQMAHPFCVIPVHRETNIEGLYQILRLLSAAINDGYYPPMEFLLIIVGWKPDDHMGTFFRAVQDGPIPGEQEFFLAKDEHCFSFGVLTFLLKAELPTYRFSLANIWEDKKQKRPYVFTGYFPRIHQVIFSNELEDIRFFTKNAKENLLYILRAKDIGITVPFIEDDRWS